MQNEFIKTGFVVTNPDSAVERPTRIPDIAKLDLSDVTQVYRSAFDLSSKHMLRERDVRDLVDKGVKAYVKDSMYKNAVDRLAEAFSDFSIGGNNPRAIMYVTSRLELMSLYNREHWKTTFGRGVTSYFKTGNTIALKIRGGSTQKAKRPLYENKPYAITALFLHSPSDLEPAYNADRQMVGWTYRTRINNKKSLQATLLIDNPKQLDTRNSLLQYDQETPLDESKPILHPLVDVLHITYTRPEGIPWGIGPMLPAIEDVSLLRIAESTIAMMMKKFSNPLYHHIITPKGGPQSSIQADINNMYMTYRKMAPEGLIITGPNHAIKAIGAESHALRMEGYLSHFTSRAAGGLASSTFGLGLEPGTLGSSEAFSQMMKSKILKCQKDFAREMEFQLLWELLYEGGFDPYSNLDDRVTLEFEDVDIDNVIKQQAHSTYLFQNNGITWDELRKDLKRDPNVFKGGLASNLFPDKKDTSPAGQGSSKQPSKKNAVEVSKALKNICPTNEKEIPGYLEYISQLGFYVDEDSFNIISNLLGDPQAILEYTFTLEKPKYPME